MRSKELTIIEVVENLIQEAIDNEVSELRSIQKFVKQNIDNPRRICLEINSRTEIANYWHDKVIEYLNVQLEIERILEAELSA